MSITSVPLAQPMGSRNFASCPVIPTVKVWASLCSRARAAADGVGRTAGRERSVGLIENEGGVGGRGHEQDRCDKSTLPHGGPPRSET